MSDLPAADGAGLARRLEVEQWNVAARQEGSDGTRKRLLELPGGARGVEGVMIPSTRGTARCTAACSS